MTVVLHAADLRVRPPCAHEVAEKTTWPWLPATNHVLAPHPWCRACGQVKAVGTGRPLDLGGLANLLGRLERRLAEDGRRLTEAQRRLILRRLARVGADDTFGLALETQITLFADVVGAHLAMHPDRVASYLRSC